MAPEEEDLYDEEFDFVDDDDTDVEDEADVEDDDEADDEAGDEDGDEDGEPAVDEADAGQETGEDESLDEYGRPEPAANYVVHVYEFQKFTRTIDRAFTPEDAEAFATEYNRTAKSYGRTAITGKNDVKPKKTISPRATNPE